MSRDTGRSMTSLTQFTWRESGLETSGWADVGHSTFPSLSSYRNASRRVKRSPTSGTKAPLASAEWWGRGRRQRNPNGRGHTVATWLRLWFDLERTSEHRDVRSVGWSTSPKERLGPGAFGQRLRL